LLREGQIRADRHAPAELALPLGLEEIDPEPALAERVSARPIRLAAAEPVKDPAARAVLRALLEELEDLRDLLPRKSR
jgi:hypothetical protein